MLSKSDVKYIQSLADKKFREEYGLFVVEGVKMVDELIKFFPDKIYRIYATKNWIDFNVQDASIKSMVQEIGDDELKKISFLTTPNQVLALVKLPPFNEPQADQTGLTLMIDQMQDPGNLGTVIRTCDWFGVSKIICSKETVDAYNPKVVQATMGSIFRVEIQYANLAELLSQDEGKIIYGAILDGKSLNSQKFLIPSILIIGNESKGISPEIRKFINHPITIDRFGNAESLNASVATAVILSHMKKT